MPEKNPKRLEDLDKRELVEFARIAFELELNLRTIDLPPCVQSFQIQKQLEHHRSMVHRIFKY